MTKGDSLNSSVQTILKKKTELSSGVQGSPLKSVQGRNLYRERTEKEELSRLHEELAVMAKENKQLESKYGAAMNKYYQEEARTSQLEEEKVGNKCIS